ncbi:MAG: ATPase [Rhodobacteraceae bacterium]|nr:ATPase [Paracoccaceae bacterium]
MRLYMGIDGGGTSCRAVVAAADGPVLGRGAAGSANIWSDPEGAGESIRAAAMGALTEAGHPDAIGSVEAVLGLAGANLPQARALIEGRLPFARAGLESDAVIALKGALGEEDGIVLVTGTGSVFGAQRGGAIRMIGGWGFRLGDQASGACMGRDLLTRALLAHDGLAPADPLLREVITEAGGPAALVARMTDAPPAEYGRYVPRLLEAAARGETAACDILSAADDALVAAIEHLGGGALLPICFLGGIGPVFAERLSGRYPGRIHPPRGTALDGALAMARAGA